MSGQNGLGWPTLGDAARHGLVGEMLGLIEHQTEADPAALVLTFAQCFGSAVGPDAYIIADGARHPARIYVVIAGNTSKARKGTALRHVRNLFDVADPNWNKYRVLKGLSSGEGLISAVWDGEADKEGTISGTVADKRLLVVEEEFSSVISVKGRDGNTLSERIREAFDDGNLRSMTKRPLIATGAHISILGHITLEELRRCLTELDRANGFANRFLFALAKRSRILPSGGSIDHPSLAALGTKLSHALAKARKIGEVHRSAEAEAEWARWYTEIADAEEEGIADALLARAEAHVLRLSLTYALLDGSSTIELAHLQAAEAVWEYCAQSVRLIFADLSGDEVTDRLLAAIVEAGEAGMGAREQHNLFSRHVSREHLALVREQLAEEGLIETHNAPTRGRDATVSVATHNALNAQRTKARYEIKPNNSNPRETTTWDDIAPLQTTTAGGDCALSALSALCPQGSPHPLIQQALEQGVEA